MAVIMNKKPAAPAPAKPIPRETAPRAVAPRTIATPGNGLNALTLPKEPTSTTGGIETTSWLIYGKKRIGKSSLAAQFPGALVFAFEAASNRVKAMRVVCDSWDKFLGYIALIKKTPNHGYKVAVIDTGFEAYGRCKEYVCRKNGVEYTSDAKDHGGIWDKVSTEFRKAQIELQSLGLQLVVVCHEQLVEQETRAGQKFDMVAPKLSKQADDYYRAAIENVIYYHHRDRQHWITLRGSDYVFAGVVGDEDDPVFMTPEGEKVYAVYAGTSPQEAFTNLQLAFSCEQNETNSDETLKYEESEMVKSMRKKAIMAAKNKK
jgi:hypothetical protein